MYYSKTKTPQISFIHNHITKRENGTTGKRQLTIYW